MELAALEWILKKTVILVCYMVNIFSGLMFFGPFFGWMAAKFFGKILAG